MAYHLPFYFICIHLRAILLPKSASIKAASTAGKLEAIANSTWDKYLQSYSWPDRRQ